MDKTPETKDCPLCDGSGWIYIKRADAVQRCKCYYKKRREFLYRNANIPERYRHCRLDNFQISSQSITKNVVKFGNLSHVLYCAKDFVNKYHDAMKGYFFYGIPGVGKTHLSVGIIRELTLELGIPCLFFDFQELMMQIRRTYDTGTEMTEEAVLSPVIETEVVLLDDLGGMKVTDWSRDMLGYIINKRYSKNRITLITSNWMDKPLTPEETLSDRIGIRLRSRLKEMCQDVHVQGEDYRGKKGPVKSS